MQEVPHQLRLDKLPTIYRVLYIRRGDRPISSTVCLEKQPFSTQKGVRLHSLPTIPNRQARHIPPK